MSLFSFFRQNKPDDDAGATNNAQFNLSAEPSSPSVKARKRRSTLQAGADSTRSMPVDPVLPEKKRARRRLVGAVALVLAAVIVLPMVLDSEPKPLPADLIIDIPSKDYGGAKMPPASSRVAAPASLDRKEEVLENLPTKNEKSADKSVDASAALALETGTDSKQAKFTVQIGAFASQEKINEVRSKLKTAGIVSHTQKVTTEAGERVRIRVGPFETRMEADKMRARLVAIGLSGTVSPFSSQ